MDMQRVGACTLGLRMLSFERAVDELCRLGYHGLGHKKFE